MLLKQFLAGNGRDEILEIERFEVRNVFEPFFVPGGFRKGSHGHGGGEGLREEGIRGGEDFPAFEGAVADEEDGTFGELGGEAAGVDDDGLRFGELLAVRGEDGGIDLHPAGVHHGHDGAAAFRDHAQAVRLADENVQRSGGEEGNSGAEAEALGGGNAHAEPRVGPRSLAYADGIQILDCQFFFVQHFLYVGGGEGGLHAGFPADAEGRHGAVLRKGGGELGGRCFDEEDAGHGATA